MWKSRLILQKYEEFFLNLNENVVIQKYCSLVVGFFLVVLSSNVLSEDFKSMVIREGNKAMSSGGKVVVFFYTEKPLATTSAQISAAMKSSNQNAIINKTWVTNITFRGYDENKKCGVIVGDWAAGAIEEEWENTVYPKVKKSIEIISFQYVKHGTLTTMSGTVGSNGDDIMELCLQ